MGKKKKGKKKKAKKSKDDGGENNVAAEEAKKQAHKIDTELSISLLEYRLKEMTMRFQEVFKENEALLKQKTEDHGTNKDMVFFLNQKLDNYYNLVDSLEKKHLNLKTSFEISDSDWEKKLKAETSSLKASLSGATTKVKLLDQELTALTDFKERKDTMEEQIASMEAELSSVREATAKQLVNLDKRRVREKQQLEQEFKQKIESAKRDSLARSQSMLHNTTRKAMKENARMAAELQYQSKAMEKLMSTNEQLVDENTQLRQEIEMHKQIQLEFAKKTQVYQRLLKKLNEKIRVKEDRERVNAQKMLLRDKELSDELLSTDEVMARLNHKVRSLEGQLQRKTRQVDVVRQKLRLHLQSDAKVQQLTDETVSLLLAAMEDIKNQIEDDPASLFNAGDFRGSSRPALPQQQQQQPTHFAELSQRGRVKVLELLLSQLQSKKISLLMRAHEMSKNQPMRGIKGLPPLMGLSESLKVQSEADRRKDIRTSIATTQTNQQELAMMTPVRPGMVQEPLREWGGRSAELPLTIHTSETFLKKGKGAVVSSKHFHNLKRRH